MIVLKRHIFLGIKGLIFILIIIFVNLLICAVGINGNNRAASVVAFFADADISKVIDAVIISKVDALII